ncbi:MAG: flagellar hook-associated protein FlgK [Planctomycetota bacterium]
MGLTGALNIGRSALTASQLGLSVTSNNMANASTPGYSRQTIDLSPIRGGFIGNSFVGRGVGIDGVGRKVDEAIASRLLAARSAETGAAQRLSSYAEVEAALGELTGSDFSTQLNGFFNAWSERANLVQNSASIVQQASGVAAFIRRLREDLTDLRAQVDLQVGATAELTNGIAQEIAGLNIQIAGLEGGGATASALRDQRDGLVGQLADLMDIDVVEQPDGQVDVLVGSQPIVLAGTARNITVRRETRNGVAEIDVVAGEDQRRLTIRGGRIGGLLEARENAVQNALGTLDNISRELIFEVNRLHANGANLSGLQDTESNLRIPVADRTRPINDPLNEAFAGLPFTPTNGGFIVRVGREGSDTQTSVRIDVDLDGIDNTGAPGVGDETSLEDLRAAIDAVDGVRATFSPDGRLRVEADQGFEFSFGEDTSGVLASVGLNAFFTGTDAGDIAVREDLIAEPSRLTTGRYVNGRLVENQTALDMASLGDRAINGLGGLSFRESWQNSVNQIGLNTQAAGVEAEAASVVRESIEAQRAAVSGVSLDEEAINLLQFQRQFQAAARIISVADELLQTLIQTV